MPAPSLRPAVSALSADRYMLKVTISGDTHARLRRAQDLLRHTIPNGDPAEILDRALTLLVEYLERRKLAATNRPRPVRSPSRSSTRYIPAAVKRAVWKRDAGRCAFEGANGQCAETGRLEFHHLRPFAAGGATTVDNLSLRCRAHNRYEGELMFGKWHASRDVISPPQIALHAARGICPTARGLGRRRCRRKLLPAWTQRISNGTCRFAVIFSPARTSIVSK